jgi:tryptophanyl-tRNA synthetase
VKGLESRSEAENLVGIYAALTGKSKEAVLAEFGGAQFSAFKKALAEVCVAKLAPVAAETKRLMSDTGEIDRVLAAGAERARAIARPILAEVKDIVGFVRS